MKFAEHLSAHITPEWRKQYIQYEVPAAAGVWEDSEGPPSRQSRPPLPPSAPAAASRRPGGLCPGAAGSHCGIPAAAGPLWAPLTFPSPAAPLPPG